MKHVSVVTKTASDGVIIDLKDVKVDSCRPWFVTIRIGWEEVIVRLSWANLAQHISEMFEFLCHVPRRQSPMILAVGRTWSKKKTTHCGTLPGGYAAYVACNESQVPGM